MSMWAWIIGSIIAMVTLAAMIASICNEKPE